ncbi:hypothetical protein AWC05_26215 [Mycobacterium florentinum]|uniref:DUF6779 domain-containing protein n=1 Tax=Mycobacterium florentinum TaxID=292462 RepID=A0A1X1U2Q7_MYCFL|nr:DUF6779 domain-containing protein [Mycobacterium florentinum]MCV7410897.1 hypothetical protein [Mycobacterium florentinum]ORV51101.1 hypothetical protein AWC05_26215 [Mycobacterium florentinum]BBX80236.1 hypothetical protein MFLOJ_40230 [Mycobacterium florentinum]
MTVLSRGARVRRGGRRPGWVLLTALLVLAIGASSALVFTNRVELLKLAVILALWAAVAGAFVSVLYRRQSDADQSRVRDLKLVYDLQLDREISARREYELTVESQLRRELASEIRAQAADDLAALRAEVVALRTSLEILFDTDLEQRPALETLETDTPHARAYSDWDRNGEGSGADWVTSDRVTSVREGASVSSSEPRTDESAIIDVPEEPLLPPRPRRFQYEGQQEAAYPPPQQVQYPEAPPYVPPPMPAPAEADQRFEPQHWQPVPPPRPDWQPVNADGLWLPPGAQGSSWTGGDAPAAQVAPSSGGRRRRHADPEEQFDGPPAENEPPQPGESGRRARSRHSAEYRDYSVRNFISPNEPGAPPAAATAPPPHPGQAPQDAEPPPPRLSPAPHLEPAPRHLGPDEGLDGGEGPQTGGQSVADLLARLQVQPSGGGRRRRREG